MQVFGQRCAIAVLGIEHCLVAWLCQRCNVIEQSTIGGTLSDRIATWVNLLSAGERIDFW